MHPPLFRPLLLISLLASTLSLLGPAPLAQPSAAQGNSSTPWVGAAPVRESTAAIMARDRLQPVGVTAENRRRPSRRAPRQQLHENARSVSSPPVASLAPSTS